MSILSWSSITDRKGALQLEYNIRSLIEHEYPGIEYIKTTTQKKNNWNQLWISPNLQKKTKRKSVMNRRNSWIQLWKLIQDPLSVLLSTESNFISDRISLTHQFFPCIPHCACVCSWRDGNGDDLKALYSSNCQYQYCLFPPGLSAHLPHLCSKMETKRYRYN